MSQSNGRRTIFFGNRKQMNLAFKIIAWLTVLSLFAGYGLFSIKELFSGDKNSGIADVNGLPIRAEEFKRNYKALNNFITMAKSEYGPNAEIALQLWGIDASKKTEDVVLEQLLQDKVLQSFANSFDMRVSKDFLDTKLQDMSFMKNYVPRDVFQGGRLDPRVLTEYLNKQGMSLDDFENQISESVRKKVLLDVVGNVGYAPEAALKDEFIKKYSKRKYAIIVVGLEEYLKQVKEKSVTDAELEQYFKVHQENYRVQEKRHANFWVFEPKEYDIVVEDKEIGDYFTKNQKSYVKEGSTKDEPLYKDLSEVKAEIKDKVTLNKFTKQFGADVNRILIESKQSPAAFNSYLTTKKANALPEILLSQDNSKQSEKIFGLNRLKEKTFFVENNKGYIGELVMIDKSYIPALKEIAERVKQDLLKKKSQEYAQEVFAKLAKEKQKTIEDINTEVTGKLIKTDWLDPQNPETIKALKDTGVRSDMLFGLESVGQRLATITDSSGLIIQLLDIDKLDQDEFAKKKDTLMANVKRTQTQNIFSDLLKNLEDTATIKTNPKLLAQVLSKR